MRQVINLSKTGSIIEGLYQSDPISIFVQYYNHLYLSNSSLNTLTMYFENRESVGLTLIIICSVLGKSVIPSKVHFNSQLGLD